MLKKKIVDTVQQLRLASQQMPKIWNGRKSILEMKDADFKQWQQIEWLDSYFKFLCQKYFDGIIDMPGKKYNITEFDAFREISWDFRIGSADAETYSCIANNSEAIADTMNDCGSYGMILAIGDIEYDNKETSFKKWHDELKKKPANMTQTKLTACAN